MIAILQAIKQSSLSCDELEENNYLKEDSKCEILLVLLSVSDFRSLKWSFSKITLGGWKHPTLCSFFALVALPQSSSVNISSSEQPHKDPVGSSWWWAVGWTPNLLLWHSQGRNSMVPCFNVFINGSCYFSWCCFPPGLTHFAVRDLFSACGISVGCSSSEFCPDCLSCFLLRSVGVFHLTSIELGLGHWQSVFKNCLQQISL